MDEHCDGIDCPVHNPTKDDSVCACCNHSDTASADVNNNCKIKSGRKSPPVFDPKKIFASLKKLKISDDKKTEKSDKRNDGDGYKKSDTDGAKKDPTFDPKRIFDPKNYPKSDGDGPTSANDKQVQTDSML